MGNLIWEELGFVDFCVLFGFGLALMIESATLVRVIRGSRHKFVIKILVILILAVKQCGLATNTNRISEITNSSLFFSNL